LIESGIGLDDAEQFDEPVASKQRLPVG